VSGAQREIEAQQQFGWTRDPAGLSINDSLAAGLVKHSRIMAAHPFVAARVTPEMKTLLRVLAEREQITGSALVRQLLEVMLRVSAKEDFLSSTR
jgi:hypothetical protein